MTLLIDFGNSRCKWAILDDKGLHEAHAYTYESNDSLDRAREVIDQIALDSIQEIHAVSVLGDDFGNAFCTQVKNLVDIDAKFHVSQVKNFGVTLAYADPLSYGADRYAAVIAAHSKTSGATIVIDCGTATTIDVIDDSGKHLGGLIVPGIELMCTALANKASGIKAPAQSNSMQLFNDNTADAVYSGSALVLSYGVHGIIDEMIAMVNQEVTVFVTGGESKTIGLTGNEYVDSPNLVLEGLRIMQG
jgi:type III pantothenate kinase